MIQCPSCGSGEQYVRVAVLYERTTSTVAGYTSASGGGVGLVGLTPAIGLGGGTSQYRGVEQSWLTRRLAPPRPPRARFPNLLAPVTTVYFTLMVLVGLPWLGFAGLIATSASPLGVFPLFATLAAFLTSALLLAGAWAWGFRVRAREYRQALDVYHDDHDRWLNRWLCTRCGYVQDGAQLAAPEWPPLPVPTVRPQLAGN